MSRTFDGTTSNYLSAASAVATAAPLTWAGFFNSSSATVGQCIAAVTDNASANFDEFRVEIRGDVAADPVRAAIVAAGTTVSADTGTYSTGVWGHAGAVFASSTSRTPYFGGAAGTTNTTSSTPSGITHTSIGVIIRPALPLPFNGSIAEVGAWNVALTTFEVAALSHGCSPLLVRPTALIGYWPLFGGYSTAGETSWIAGSVNLAETGTVGSSAHPTKPMSYPVP